MTLDLSKFQATGFETCFHDRHIQPQISLPLLRILPVTRKTLLRQHRPDIAIKPQRPAKGSQRREQKKKRIAMFHLNQPITCCH